MARKILAGVALMLIGSCTAADATSPVALYPGSAEGHGASVRGKLVHVGKCLYIEGEGGERWLAAFPSPSTTWEPNEESVRVGDQSVNVGTAARFNGGETKGGARSIAWVREPDGSCDGSKIWLVMSISGD